MSVEREFISREVITKKRYGYWHELLEQWTFLVERVYRVAGEKNAVYSYKERTNVGLLSAAATANGWIALEECRLNKKDATDIEEIYQGRADLRIWRDKRYHEIEAKFLRIPLTSKSKTRLTRAAEKSIADSSRSIKTGAKSDRKIAVTFVVPTISEIEEKQLSKEKKEYQEELLKFIKDRKPDFTAYAFPGPACSVGSKGNRKALGVIMFGMEPPDVA